MYLQQSLDEIRVLRYLNKLKGFEAAHLLRLHDFFFNKQHLIIVTEVATPTRLNRSCCSRDCTTSPTCWTTTRSFRRTSPWPAFA